MGRIFSLRSQSIKQASTILAVTALLSNSLGLVRNLIFYRTIAPAQLDTYFASFRIADFLFNLIIIGAVTSSVIPVISELITKEREEKAREIINQLLSWATIIMGGIVLFLVLVMPFIIRLVVPGFDEARILETTSLSRLLLLQTIFFSWSFIIGALLNGYRRFTTYAIAPLLYNCSLIIGGLLAGKLGVHALVYTVVFGSFLHCLVQYFEVRRIGYIPSLDLRVTPELKKIFQLMIPRSLSQGTTQIVLIVYTMLASGLRVGSIAIFNGMNDLQTTPTVIVANSLATAYFPSLTAEVAKENWDKVNILLVKVIRASLFLLVPLVILSLVLRAQVVRLYFGLGSVDWNLTSLAISTFAWFVLSIIPASLVVILSRLFYATKDTYTPMAINITTSILGICASVVGIRFLHGSVATLALSEALIAASQCLFYLIILSRRGYLSLRTEQMADLLTTIFIGSLLLASGTWLTLRLVDSVYSLLPWISTGRVIGLLIQSLLATAVGLFLYFRYSTIRKVEELEWLKKRAFSRGQ